jgi:hypothetical protein
MYENSSILYLKPGILDHEHVQQMEAKLKGMQKAGNKKVLLDLRDVAAGDMPEATRLANFFAEERDDCDAGGAEVPQAGVYGGPFEGDQRDGAGGGAGEPRDGGAGGAGGGGAAATTSGRMWWARRRLARARSRRRSSCRMARR